jgi:hypothetical protein
MNSLIGRWTWKSMARGIGSLLSLVFGWYQESVVWSSDAVYGVENQADHAILLDAHLTRWEISVDPGAGKR